eukprot:c7621_g1_i1.p1 GENE.c7621_g1_i1~~c7621_g1_i1.p1  ORF type:complete len:195 (+),score=82.49 c7621_g1_i1:117-701(+)
MQQRNYKVVLLGEGRVGKTSIVVRFVHDQYTDKQQTTMRATYLDKQVLVGQEKVNLAIWDTAGQERFHTLGPIYYRDADAALLVFDITDNDSFIKVQQWIKELRKIVGEDIIICIAGNKSDLNSTRQVQRQEAEAYSEEVGAAYFETSAKLNRNISEVFDLLAKKLVETKKAVPQKPRLKILEDEQKPQQTECC